MTDFQSRLNQFRQGLSDQQDAYNKLATNMAQMGRTVLPDKLAAHYDYMEKVGGIITGVSATAHGGKKMVSRLARYRQQKQAVRNNGMGSEPRTQPRIQAKRATTEEQDAVSEQQQRTITETDPANEPEEPENPADLNPVGETGRRAREAAGGEEEEEPEPKPTQGKLSFEDIQNLTQESDQSGLRAQGELIGGDEFGVGARVGTEAEAPRPEPPKPEPTRPAPPKPAGTAEGDAQPVGTTEEKTLEQKQADLEEGAKAFEGQGKIVNTETDLTDTLNQVADTGIKQVVKKGVGKIVGEGVGEALGDAIPFLGEAIGLGTLIAGIVKAHKHEENSPGPKLSKAAPEPMEQSGGFSAEMLKGGLGAPSIV